MIAALVGLASVWVPGVAAAQGEGVFSVLADAGGAGSVAMAGPRGVVFTVDMERFAALAGAAPDGRAGENLDRYGLELDLPHPSGGLVRCRAAISPVMEPGLGARFPEIRTLLVQSADRLATGRIEITPRGLTGMLRGADGVWMIDLWKPGDPSMCVAHWLRDLVVNGEDAGAWNCETLEGVHGLGAPIDDVEGGRPIADRGPGEAVSLRTIRLAVACTGEYGLHQCQLLGHQPNTADPLAAIVTAVSRVNVIYEADAAIHFNLVNGNDRIVYVDPVTDPYPDSCDGTGGGDCSGPYLGANVTNLGAVIGNANFDVGHLLTRVYGGVAYLSSICTNNKAGGISGIPRGGDVDALAFLVMAHEMGHQLGATHTFSGTRGRCGNNATLGTAWEAGGGSSPMAYPGGCPVGDALPSDNLVLFADPWFHLGSLEQMRSTLVTHVCPVQTATANTAPVLGFSPGNWSIPPGTPFQLTASASDSGGDQLSYSWEEFDSGLARPLTGDGSADNGSGALFRVFPPVPAAARSFPRMADVLSGTATPGERLPVVSGTTRRFRVIVRDQRPGAGGTATSASTTLTVASVATPFALVSPPAPGEETSVMFAPPGRNTVAWTVGNTDASPVNCASVEVRFSFDDGETFPLVLGTFANNGAAAVNLPDGVASARVKVSAVGNVFFAVSARFTVGYCPADINQDHAVGVQDIFDFLAAYFEGDPRADIDHGGSVTVQDIFDYLSSYFRGC